MSLLLIIVVLLLVFAIGYWWFQQTKPVELPHFTDHQIVLGQGQPCAKPIPQIIWTYWHSPTLPLVVEQCIAGWRRFNPEYRIEVLNKDNLADFISPIPAHLERLNVAKQTDWMRLELLNRYGGIWMDASIILTQPLDWVGQLQRQQAAEFVGYYIDGYTQRKELPVVDSWFLAAPAGSRFIADWLSLFKQQAVVGDTEDYIAKLEQSGRLADVRQGIGDPYYHTVHIAAQDVLSQHVAGYKLALIRAEDSAFALHACAKWRRKRLYVRLLWNTQAERPLMIKLRGGERTKLEGYLRRGLFRRDSIVGRMQR
ncbi:MAG: capsular polysaccharide synthesis protein [Firmicutes bacterium]|nr:capsular polysaccharide synthesis protein [Bacillota bacterium]